MNKKKIIIIIGVLVLFLVSLITVGLITKNKYSKKISNLEKIHIQEFINDYGVSLEQVDTDETKENDRYISYALYYNLDDTNKVSLSNKEIKDTIDKVFNVNISEEEIKNIGITPYLLNNFIKYDVTNDTYELDISNLKNADIAKIPIIKYEISKVKEVKEDRYEVELMQYKVSNPYEILNYYMDKNDYDTKNISDYLSGDKNIKVMKEALDLEALRNIQNEGTKIKATFIVKDNKLLLDSIRI